MSEETYQYITLISFKGSLSPGEEGSLCFGERGHFQLAKGTFLSWPDRVILVCFIHIGGFLVGFGTRYAGGCTSGHAIMGISSLQWPSLIATCCFMAGGFAMTWFILPYLLKL